MVMTTDLRLADPGTFVNGPPHELFKRLRTEAPVYWEPLPEGGGFWALTKYHDLIAASQDYSIFSSSYGTNIEDAQGGVELMMINMDPPRHTKLRTLVSKGFTPKMVRAMEPHVREIATSIVDGVAKKGSCDFVTEVAAELPLQVIAELIGIPMDERHLVFDWSNRMIGLDDPEYGNSLEEASQAAVSMFAYADTLAKQHRKERKDDLINALLDAEVDGEQLTEMEFNVFFLLLAVAGNETTRNLISGGMHALCEYPEQFARLRADPDLLTTAVEEMLRWVTPVMYFRRTVMRDTELGGQRMREGEKVTLWYIAANRDEEVFPDGDTFDAGRSPNNHLAFGGGGAHFCLGASLARLEIRVIFEEILRRLPDIKLAGPVAHLRSNFINGTKHMPVTFTPETR